MTNRCDKPPSSAGTARRRPSRRRGQNLVELAIAVPLLLMFLLGTVDLGRMFFGYIELRNAAFEGARYAITNPSDTTGIKAQVEDHGVPSGTTVTVSCSNGDCGSITAGSSVTVTVTASATFQPIFTTLTERYFGIGSFTMTGSATTKVAT